MSSLSDHQLRRALPLAAWASMVLAACQDPEAAPTKSTAGDSHPQFTVRGRWPDASQLSFRLDLRDAAVSEEVFRGAVLQAMHRWQATGVVGFVEAEAGDEFPDILLAWRRTAHGDCEPFGSSPGVAHSGPVGNGSFVHFDAGREWSSDGSAGHSLLYAATHELGHVLGLGHCDAEGALMRPDLIDGQASLSSSEFAGIHSLYGGGEDSPDDLQVIDQAGTAADKLLACLRQVAAIGISDFTVFDSDGDGDDEVLVWRTDHAGYGALMIYHFGSGPRLERTLGPLYGSAVSGARSLFLRSDDGERVMLCLFSDGRIRMHSFDASGLPRSRAEGAALVVDGSHADADGDGVLDASFRLQESPNRTGDLDGDGRRETVQRRN